MEELGTILIKVGGKMRFFKFGMRTNRLLSVTIDLAEVSKNYNDFLLHIFWAGLVIGDKFIDSEGKYIYRNELPKGFEELKNIADGVASPLEIVSEWIDELGVEEAAKVYQVAEQSMGFIMKLMEKADQLQKQSPIA